MSHTGRRVLWTVIGVLLLAVGVLGLLAGLGWLPGVAAGTPVLWSGLTRWWRSVAPWGAVGTALLGLLLAWLGFVLLTRELRVRPSLGELVLDPGGRDGAAPGRTVTRGAVLADALERDLRRDHRVRDASVALSGRPDRPRVRIELDVGPRTRLADLRAPVDAAVHRWRLTAGREPDRVEVVARIGPTGSRRVGRASTGPR